MEFICLGPLVSVSACLERELNGRAVSESSPRKSIIGMIFAGRTLQMQP